MRGAGGILRCKSCESLFSGMIFDICVAGPPVAACSSALSGLDVNLSRATWYLPNAKSSLGDAKSSLGDAKNPDWTR
jgi:hypothetical protein